MPTPVPSAAANLRPGRPLVCPANELLAVEQQREPFYPVRRPRPLTALGVPRGLTRAQDILDRRRDPRRRGAKREAVNPARPGPHSQAVRPENEGGPRGRPCWPGTSAWPGSGLRRGAAGPNLLAPVAIVPDLPHEVRHLVARLVGAGRPVDRRRRPMGWCGAVQVIIGPWIAARDAMLASLGESGEARLRDSGRAERSLVGPTS